MRKFIVLLVVLVSAGCKQIPDVPTVITPYRIDIQQGNLLTQEMVAKLKPGMTRAQVRFTLGSPLVVDPFRTDRWDYVYMYQKQGKETERRNITVILSCLARLESPPKPAAKPPTAATPPVKSPAAATPALKPPAVAVKPVIASPAKPETATGPASFEATNPDNAAPEVKVDAAKTGAQAAKPEATKDKPKEEKGFFGRMLDKIGF